MGSAQAQQRTITGTVTEAETNEPLPGVNVFVNNTNIGTSTNENGGYSLSRVPADADSLIFSFVGFQRLAVSIGSRSEINVTLQPTIQSLSDVVVTSFGIEQERKELGYSTQQIDSENLTVGNQTNMVNALSGKVSGVEITNTGGAPGRSSRIVIRGVNSLDPGANNQPLFVVDGVPIDNSTIESSGTPRGMSNRAADLNPNDIKSVNILKGSAATALYGVRAANGAVIITTKRGQAGETQINLNSTVGFDRINAYPEFQEVYGQGFSFQHQPESFWPNWGAKIEDVRENINPDWQYYDIWRDAAQTGVQLDNSINVSGGNENATYYASVSNLQHEGVLPYGNWDRTSVRLSGDISPRENLTVRASANYINSGGNRVLGDRFMESMMYWAPTKDVTNFEKENGTMRGYYNNEGSGNNPIYQAKHWTYEDDVNRMVGNVTLNYNPTEWFNVLYTLGSDYYSDQRTEIIPGPRGVENENVVSSTGAIEETRINSRDLNSTLNLTFRKDVTEKVSTRLRVGNDIFDRSFNNVVSTGSDFVTPLFYHLSNVRDISLSQTIRQRRLIGAYGDLMIDYDNFLYLNLTGRNDWSSTLPEDNRSFFYPSANIGFTFSDIMDLPDYVTYGKLRTSYSVVGKDAPVYATSNTYNTPSQFPLGGQVGFTRSNIRGSADLKPEQTTTLELGTDLRFLDNRLRFDFTWYKSNSRDQIFDVPISNATGYTRIITNAGEIENKGIELQIEGRPVQTRDFVWDVAVNYSQNRSEVVEIAEGINQILLGSSYGYAGSSASIQLTEGDPFGNIYGRSYERYYESGEPEDNIYLDEDRPIVIGDDGFPVVNTDQKVLGNTQPDWIGSIRNDFSYKNFNISFLIDAKWGQDVYSQYDNFFTAFGITKNTLNREDYHVFEGVTADGQPNTQEVWLGQGLDPEGRIDPGTGSVRDYGAGYHRNVKRGSTEEFVLDASYIKLRNIRLAYSLPQDLVTDLGLRRVTLSTTATNIILYTPFSGFDPESRAGGASTNAQGFTALDYPGVASFFFSVNLSL
ncbi:SusC/RagA family TonB-linked outer membrane protein [Gracilimonas halophila]|uniref:SusC/RagA family TonB-linked outer membrane protein n=1 Tax=Gracilimonas halophila TaxID=1834464 RepID=A0ABW5JHK3_9BACT